MAPMTVVEAILGGAALAAALLYGIAYGVRAGHGRPGRPRAQEQGRHGAVGVVG